MDPQTLNIALWGLAVFTVLGLLFGVRARGGGAALPGASATRSSTAVRDRLPSANCGACGFAGCQAYAEAVVERPDVSTSLCTPGPRARRAGAGAS